MTPSARVKAAIDILDEILTGAPAEKALTGWARRSRFAGSKDRAAVRDHVFDALRNLETAAALGGGKTGRAVMIGVLRLQDQAVEALFTGEGYAPSALTDAEQSIRLEAPTPVDLPDWVIAPLKASLGAEYDSTLEAMGQRAPVTLRVNLAKSNRGVVQDALAKEGIETRPLALVDSALEVVAGARRIKQSPLYLSGDLELQDASSQAMVAGLPLKDGMRVMDYCAGGGGKSLAMAARIEGTFFAHDANPKRMADLPERARRAGVTIRQTDNPSDAAPYDFVLCDVPCSGSGTWRRTPDAKWRFTKGDLEDLITLQAQILDEAAHFVAPNGCLAYATCSFLQEENARQIEAFCARHSEWRVEWTKQFGFADGGDGFFGAVLTRG